MDVVTPGTPGAGTGTGTVPVIPAQPTPTVPDGPAITTEAGRDFITVADLQDPGASLAARNAAAAGTPPAAPVQEPAPGTPAAPAAPAATPPATTASPGQQSDTPPGTGASAEGTPTSDSTKPAPYDQDPKWKAARAAEKRLESLRTKFNFDDLEALEDFLDDSWDARQAAQAAGTPGAPGTAPNAATTPAPGIDPLELPEDLAVDPENDSPDVITEKLGKQVSLLQNHIKAGSDRQARYNESVQAIGEFNAEVNRVLAAEDVPEVHQDILRPFLGVDNPADNVDPSKRSSIRQMARSGIARFNEFVQSIQQQAVDTYAAGKSGLTPSVAGAGPSTGTPAPGAAPGQPPAQQPIPVTEVGQVAQPAQQAVPGTAPQTSAEIVDHASVDKEFGNLNAQLLEALMKEEGM